MSTQQTIIWTTLPNGFTETGNPRLSLHISPHLVLDAALGNTLEPFTDFLDWPNTLKGITEFTVHFDDGSTAAAEWVSKGELRPAWWRALFNKNTFIRPYTFDDYTDNFIISYPAQLIHNHLKSYYQDVGYTAFDGLPQKYVLTGETLHNDENRGWIDQLGQIDWTARDAAAFRAQLINEQNHDTGPLVLRTAVSDTAPTQANRETAFKKMLLFHSPAVDPADPSFEPPTNRPPLPKTEDEFKEYIDFHQALSSLGDYPILMRHLGIVLDLEIPADAIPPNAQFIWVEPQWTSAIDPNSSDSFPQTAFLHDGSQFTAAPDPTAPEIVHGLLNLDENTHALSQIDIDGAALKSINFATSMTHENELSAPDTPERSGIPTMRSAGLSLLYNGLDQKTYGHFSNTEQHNQTLEAGDVVQLYAEDLQRGFRVDIYHEPSAQWFSLCQRVGDYLFVNKNISLKNQEDEGFVQMSLTGATEPEEGQPPVTDDFYLHESLVRWEGWSLSAPRLGKMLSESPNPGDPPKENSSPPMTPFKLQTSFTPAQKSLPRLRFGSTYRLRVRIADLAGNGITLEEADETAVIPPITKPPTTYLRYEPIASPKITPRTKFDKLPGESQARLVIRSFNDEPGKDTAVINNTSDRHISPPPTSQLMLETIGVFDDEDGKLMNSKAIYDYIVAHDKPVDPNADSEPVVSGKQMKIDYLADILAAGVALRDLPHTPDESVGEEQAYGDLFYRQLPAVDARPGSATLIPYGRTHEIPKGLQALYTFFEQGGNIVHDVSGHKDPIHLTIADPQNVAWEAGALTIDAPTILTADNTAKRLNTALRNSQAFTIEAWIEPAPGDQSGPARIATLSQDTVKRNLTLAQSIDDSGDSVFVGRLRTNNPQTSGNGLPQMETPGGLVRPQLTHLVYTRNKSGRIKIFVNGAEVVSLKREGDFENWNNNFGFALANEHTLNRPWLGTYHMLAVYNRALTPAEVQAHCANGAELPLTPIPLFEQLKDLRPFRLQLAEGDSLPVWNQAERVLQIPLPKAAIRTTELSSYLLPKNLRLMGIWAWLREFVDQLVLDNQEWPDNLIEIARRLAQMVQYASEGGHWMLTPSRTVTFVHAVQQPLGHPDILALSAGRERGSLKAKLFGQIEVHGDSTDKVDLQAQWSEMVDRLAEPGPRQISAEAHAAELPLKSLADNASIEVDNKKVVGKYDRDKDHINLTNSAFPEQMFGDTKHRRVTYKAVSTSRFRDYFVDLAEDFSRESEPLVVNVPSSERPSAPNIAYVIPAFGWTRDTTTNMIASKREGRTLRVYLNRPWFDSGDGELLGVVVLPDNQKLGNNENREKHKNHITQWGRDPIWDTLDFSSFNSLPRVGSFANRVAAGEDLRLPELERLTSASQRVDVAGHAVAYDEKRQLWYSDIVVYHSVDTYTPFIRLALARYQPNSIEGTHLSPVALADFAQLAPDRAAVLTYDPYVPNFLTLTVSGYTYKTTADVDAPPEERIEVSVEKRVDDFVSDVGWETAVDTIIFNEDISSEEKLRWHGKIELPEDYEPGQYRVVIREYEVLPREIGPTIAHERRLVYADIIQL